MKLGKVAFTAVWAAGVTAAPAALVLDTGDPTVGSRPAMSYNQYFADQFTLNSATTITGLQTNLQGPANDVNYVIYVDNGGLPGTKLFSKTYSVSNQNFASWVGPSVNYALDAGTYWLAFEYVTDNNYGLSIGENAPAVVPSAFTNNSYTNYTRNQFYSVSARIYSGTTSAVPEPTTWVMMVGGFGLIGGAMRRRRTQVSFA